MKVSIIQPEYCMDYSRNDEFFEKSIALLDKCDESMDLIVCPESFDTPCYAGTKEETEKAVAKYNKLMLDKVSATAKRCGALLFINGKCQTPTGLRNTTYAFDKNGEIIGHYYKEHLVPNETNIIGLDSDYTFEFTQPTVMEIDGVRYGFLTCYDFYFYENFANLARYNLDVIIGCSHQRSDRHEAVEIISRFLAYNTNAYVVRASVSMDQNSNIGGASMIVAPDGEVLANMKSRVGIASVDIDVTKKYYKPAGFGNPDAAHYQYIEQGRRPWKYRPAGSAIARPDRLMKYPRVCAHRGFNTIAPENSMPAFGAAVSMGADEIEFDLWYTKDGEIVSIHDSTLERVSNGVGNVFDCTYEELLKYDFGSKHGEKFAGMKIITFEEILKKFACHVVMNVHIKAIDDEVEYDRATMQKIIDLIDKYDCRQYVYFMSGNDNILALCQEMAPDICRCVGYSFSPNNKRDMVDRALAYDCKKIQLFKPYFDQALIDKAHENGIICNVFWSDDPKEAKEFLDMGIQTILTNDYNLVAQAVEEYKADK